MSEEKKLRELLLKANENPEFRKKFLNNPEKVAEENHLKLDPKYLKKIHKTAAFIDSLIDIELPPGPIFYPLDGFLKKWAIREMGRVSIGSNGSIIITSTGKIIWNPPGYPRDIGRIIDIGNMIGNMIDLRNVRREIDNRMQ